MPELHEKVLEIYLAEYNSVRKEIELRLGWQFLTLSAAVPYYGLMLVSIVNSLTRDGDKSAMWDSQYPLLLGALVLGSSLLGLIACNQDLMILRLGNYTRRKIVPKVAAIVNDPDVLGWEKYTRSRYHRGMGAMLSVTVHVLLGVGAILGTIVFIATCQSAGKNGSAISYPSPGQWALAGFCGLALFAFAASAAAVVWLGRDLGDQPDPAAELTPVNAEGVALVETQRSTDRRVDTNLSHHKHGRRIGK